MKTRLLVALLAVSLVACLAWLWLLRQENETLRDELAAVKLTMAARPKPTPVQPPIAKASASPDKPEPEVHESPAVSAVQIVEGSLNESQRTYFESYFTGLSDEDAQQENKEWNLLSAGGGYKTVHAIICLASKSEEVAVTDSIIVRFIPAADVGHSFVAALSHQMATFLSPTLADGKPHLIVAKMFNRSDGFRITSAWGLDTWGQDKSSRSSQSPAPSTQTVPAASPQSNP